VDTDEKKAVWDAIDEMRVHQNESAHTLIRTATNVEWIVQKMKDDRDGLKESLKGVCDDLSRVKSDVGELKIKAGIVAGAVALAILGIKLAIEWFAGHGGK